MSLLYESRGLSRAQLARLTELSSVTVSGLVAALVSQGLVVEEAVSASGRPGRPATVLQLDTGSHTIMSVDLTRPGYVTGALISLRGDVRARAGRSIEGGNADVESLLGVVQDLQACGGTVSGLGVALLSQDEAAALPQTYPAWSPKTVRQALSPAGLPLSVGGSARLVALAEHRFGRHGRSDDLLRVDIGAHLGIGLLVGGAPLPIRSSAVSHSQVPGNDTPCPCGRRGCVRAVLAGLAVAARAATSRSARTRLVEEAGRILGTTLRPVVELLGIDDVIVHSAVGLVDATFLAAVEAAFSPGESERHASTLRVRTSELGDDAVLLGASALVLRDQLGIR